MSKTILILGATGGVGSAVAQALAAHGWTIRALARKVPDEACGCDWRQGDAMNAADVAEAARGVDAILHGVNPPGYRNWGKLVLPMLDNSIAAAKAEGARLVLPGTIYNYDPAEVPVATPDSPQHAATTKGKIRVEMERRIEASGVAALILRCGDFFGPGARNNWLSQGLVTPGKPLAAITYPGDTGVGHAWAYLPDVGEAFARLLDRADTLPLFARYHFEGIWDADGTAFTNAIRRVAGKPDLTIKRLPWSLLRFVAPFNETIRELREMRPFWRHPLRLDNTTLEQAIGPEPHTPTDGALRPTLRSLGVLRG